ncbi:MAG: hypothetical protein WC374_09165 [Phycisphaerae bacterium]|jgi:hypothetical protein
MAIEKNKSEKMADIVLTNGATVAKLFGVQCPASAVLGVIVDSIKERRSRKHIDRLENLILSVEERVKRLEISESYTPDVDLFDEIVAKAISDEDEGKIEFYAALIEYCISQKTDPYEIRLLSNSLQQLTVYEINAFYDFAVNENVKWGIPKQLEEILWNRVEGLGLYSGSIKYSRNTTIIGKKFLKIIALAKTTQ